MGLFKFRAKDMVVIIIAAAACASVVSGSITDKNDEILVQSSEKSEGGLREIIDSDIKPINDTRHEKKIIHRLIGGHVKLHRKDERRMEKDEDLSASSAGNGKEKNQREDDDEKKSLSQQVKEGKYGLIQNEIYPTTPKRPGVISYLGNPEVPRDTSRNFGGLEEDEIWLAENHLLVLRGGKFPVHGNRKPETNTSPWVPIDDYEAPKRQVKIPSRPKVPPPFPIQLTEGGPVQIIRANGSVSIINDTTDYDEYANYPEGFFPGETPFYPSPFNDSSELNIPGNGSYLPPASGTSDPFYSSLPPGAVFLPPPNNRSEDYDEDDQSIYYPPPYSFQYHQDRENATLVPPGPLVPGIILPPPPDFFQGLNEENSLTKIPTTSQTPEKEITKSTTYTPPRRKTIAKPSLKERITTTPNSPTTVTTTTRPTTNTRITSRKNLAKTKTRNFITPSYDLDTTTITTTIIPEKSTTNYYKTEIENQLVDLGPPQEGEWTGIISTTSVPLLAYFETTPSSSERIKNTEDLAPVHVEADISDKNQASYYFYEETNAGGISPTTTTTTTTPSPQVYFETSTPSPYYNIEPLIPQRQSKNHQYYSVEMIPSQQTANDYETKLKTLTKTGSSFNEFSVQEIPRNLAKYNVERIRGKSEQTLIDNSQRYYQSASAKPYYTTQRPRFYYRAPEDQRYDYRDERELKSNPLYQYNYETSDYAKHQRQQGYRNQEEEVYTDYQQPPTISGNRYYDYETRPIEKTEKKTPHRVSYSQPLQRQTYSTDTGRPVETTINTTPNPEHAYYTRQEEQLLDDVTKQYFTIFGKKLPQVGIQSTTPLYRVAVTTTENPVNTYVQNRYNDAPVHQIPRFKPPKVKVHYGDQTQRPYSLEGDTLVNYKNPLPTINPDAEYINVGEPAVVTRDREEFETEPISPFRNQPVRVENYPPVSNSRESYRGRYPTQSAISLANDIAVNYRNPRPPINPDAEFIEPIQGQGNLGNGGGSYFAYKLPGNGGHFYFLTPQAISQRQDIDREYFYSKPIDPRLIRRRRRGPAEG